MSRTIDDARLIAVDALNKTRLHDTDKVDTFLLTRRLGIWLELFWDMPALSGFCIKHTEKNFIYLSKWEKYVRKQFSCGHEIGHILDPTVPANGSGIHTEEQEQFADWISAELKMPEFHVRLLVKLYGPNPGILAHCMNVSDEAMKRRLTELGYHIPAASLTSRSKDFWIYGNPNYAQSIGRSL